MAQVRLFTQIFKTNARQDIGDLNGIGNQLMYKSDKVV